METSRPFRELWLFWATQQNGLRYSWADVRRHLTTCECCAVGALYDTHFRSSADVVSVGIWAGGRGGQLTGDGVGGGGLPVLHQPSSEQPFVKGEKLTPKVDLNPSDLEEISVPGFGKAAEQVLENFGWTGLAAATVGLSPAGNIKRILEIFFSSTESYSRRRHSIGAR